MSENTNTLEAVQTVAITPEQEVAPVADEQQAVDNRTHSSVLLPAGTKLVVKDPILHVENLTLWSNQMLINAAEGRKARIITEPMKIRAIFHVLSDWRNGEFLKLQDQNGLFQLKVSVADMQAAKDIENVGVVCVAYDGTYTKNIVGLAGVKEEIFAAAVNEIDKAEAMSAWYRLSWIGGQLKLSRRLVNLDAKLGESDDTTHMRRQLFRAIVVRELLEAEANKQAILAKWTYQQGYEASWYIRQFSLDAKTAFANKQQHVVAAQVFARNARFNASSTTHRSDDKIEVVKTVITTNGGQKETAEVKTVYDGETLIELAEGGAVKVTSLIGKEIYLSTPGGMPYPGPSRFVTAANAKDVARFVAGNGLRVNVM